MLNLLFWTSFILILYTYLGYILLLLILSGFKKILIRASHGKQDSNILPKVSLLIAAYNEKDIVELKMQNTRALDYPTDKLEIVWITDGSNDGTPELLRKYTGIKVLHEAERKGKTHALNRAMQYITSPYVVFCDANTLLAPNSIQHLIAPFSDSSVGCVAGEKRIGTSNAESAAGAGEGAYWQYESWIKQLESYLGSTMGAAGELYAIRTELFEEIGPHFIIDDFVNSLQIVQKGYRIKYAHKALALERPSASIKEELKRKIRIASGGIQTIVAFPSLLNIFKFKLFSVQYISHKVLRWTLVPWLFIVLFVVNLVFCLQIHWQVSFFTLFFMLQLAFYLMVLLGGFFEHKTTHNKFLFFPYYLAIMNYAQIAGLMRFLRGKHSVVWEKVQRA